jgi:hypothetical protein
VSPPYDIILVVGGIILLLLLVLLVVIFLVVRSRRRERMIYQALASGQPELALWLSQGTRRLVAGVLLLVACYFIVACFAERLYIGFWLAVPVGVICAVIIFKRPRLKVPPASVPPPAAGSAPEGTPPMQAAPGPPPPPLAPPSNGIVETILAVALAILIIFAGLILLRYSATIVLVAGVIALVYLASSRERREKFYRAAGRQTGKFQDWLNRKAGNGES